ncbi:MAG: hypothetical protein O3A00_04620 [Planctomycetota bacterium]|nr:hypothetical protein [Planctomycetota bacterium]
MISVRHPPTDEYGWITLHNRPIELGSTRVPLEQRLPFFVGQPVRVLAADVDRGSAGSVQKLANMRLAPASPKRFILEDELFVGGHARSRYKKPLALADERVGLAAVTFLSLAFLSALQIADERFSGDRKFVFVAFSDHDLTVLRMLSLPCTPAAGLATMNGERLRRLFGGAPGVPGIASDAGHTVSVASASYRLVLAGWSVAELKDEQPGGVTLAVECLLKAEDAFGFDTSRRIGIWQPTAPEMNRIRSAAEFQDRALVRKLIWQSVGRSTCSVRQYWEEIATRTAADYEAARRELMHTLKRARELGFQSSEIAKKLEAFNRSFDKSVVDAIVGDAMAASDSVDRALLLAASELMGHWHKSSSLVRSTEDGVSGRYHPREKALHPEELKERLRVVDGLVKIHRELTRNK